ncbi:MAG: TraB/GumN family protein [Arenicella sp.]
MKKITTIVLSACIVTGITTLATAKTSVWKVSKDERELYLGGTVHVLGADDYPLPCEYQMAYSKADTLVFETDFSALNSAEFGQKALQAGMYPVGESLQQKIQPETKVRLEAYLSSIGIPAAAVMQFKPGMLMSMMMMTELQRQGITTKGVDQYFTDLAITDGKTIGELETIEQQLSFLTALGVGDEERFISYLIDGMGKLDQQFSAMIKTWRTGNLEGLSEASEIKQMREEFPEVFEVLLHRRNNDWMPKIEDMLKTPEVEYVLVGTMHMAEDIGLLEQLSNRGYDIIQLDGCSG